ncbi:hypothetical protein PGT21_019347 [Puccinia graminis f. sp. tritici]|uniref:Uncharacterized protein n=1 Tax=Puccinia graminis f. sp. tritici TaxID=56615 RepID=A0A5B0MK85_PUCGR|nr:hypothetical protein PGTUg99_003576 [Puccinia graminis f. sp. tritici]KAA1084156.1 hypothetical protein PGT21_019347 [Puccinia graminis f. sp. tritici]
MDGHANESNGRLEKPGCSELVESVHACSRSLKDHLAQQPPAPQQHPSTSPSSRSATSSTNELSRKTKIKLQGLLAESLDDLLAVYLDLMVGSVEDRVMKPELEKLRTYFRRTARSSKSQEGRQELIGGTSRRFIEHGVGGGRRGRGGPKTGSSSTSSPTTPKARQDPDGEGDDDESLNGPKKARLAAPEIEEKIRAGRLAHHPGLPQIRQVVKTSHPCHKDINPQGGNEEDEEDDSDDDGELKVYDD